MKSLPRHRRLGMERCEQRRVLSANPFDANALWFNGAQDSNYLQAASSGLTPIDADSELVAIPTIQFNLDRAAGTVALQEFQITASDLSFSDHSVSDLNGRFQIGGQSLRYDFNLTDVLADSVALADSIIRVEVPNAYWSNPTATTNNALLPDVLVEDNGAESVVPFDPVGDGSDRVIDLDPEPNPNVVPSTSLVEGDKQADDLKGEAKSPTDYLPPRREPQSGVGVIQRVVADSLPAGFERPGAGLIDLAQLLEPAGHRTTLVAASDPVVVPPANFAARDAALAVESWVRSVPTTSTPQMGQIQWGEVPNEALRAEESKASVPEAVTEPTRQDGQSTTAQANQSAHPAQSPLAVSSGATDVSRETEVVAPGVMERSSAYRLAIAAFSTLLGGGLVWVARRQSPEAVCLERPRRRDSRSMNDRVR